MEMSVERFFFAIKRHECNCIVLNHKCFQKNTIILNDITNDFVLYVKFAFYIFLQVI